MSKFNKDFSLRPCASGQASEIGFSRPGAQQPAWTPPGEAKVDYCVEQSAQKQATTIAKVDERHASRPSDFTTTVARSKTAIELMNESGKSRCAEFTELSNGDFQKTQPHQREHKRGCRVRQDIYEQGGFNLRETL